MTTFECGCMYSTYRNLKCNGSKLTSYLYSKYCTYVTYQNLYVRPLQLQNIITEFTVLSLMMRIFELNDVCIQSYYLDEVLTVILHTILYVRYNMYRFNVLTQYIQ